MVIAFYNLLNDSILQESEWQTGTFYARKSPIGTTPTELSANHSRHIHQMASRALEDFHAVGRSEALNHLRGGLSTFSRRHRTWSTNLLNNNLARETKKAVSVCLG